MSGQLVSHLALPKKEGWDKYPDEGPINFPHEGVRWQLKHYKRERNPHNSGLEPRKIPIRIDISHL